MKKVRPNIFETNSSSTHSISVKELDSTEVLDTSLVPDSDGCIVLLGGEFGWEWNRFNDALTKANYCAVDQQTNPDNLEMLERVIKEQTGVKGVISRISTDQSQNHGSCVDHQSAGTSQEVFSSDESLRNFIFNKESFLFTGNDNGDAPANFYDVDPDVIHLYKPKSQ